jgi:GTPase SAR1 family protein
MGCVGSASRNDAETTKQIERDIRLESAKQGKILKILLLGTGDSGKSTFFKQVRAIHAGEKKLSNAETKKFIKVLRQNVKYSMQCLISSCRERKCELPKLTDKVEAAISNEDPEQLTEDTAKLIDKLWKEKAIAEAFRRRQELKIHVPTNAEYYFDNVLRFAEPDFTPSFDDIMMSKLKTTGVQEAKFESDKNDIVLVDVGGQRSERRKWLHCLDDVVAIIYMAAMDDYDSMLEEDGATNRLQESLELFTTVTGSAYFADKGWILFLNKKDLFQKKIKDKPLNKFFTDIDAKAGCDYDKASNYLLEKYKKAFQGKQIQHHFTCALDTDQCKHVFNDVKEFILSGILDEQGL